MAGMIPQQAQAQQMMQPQAPQQSGQAAMQGQPPDPTQMVSEMGMALAEALGPQQAGQLMIQVGQQIAQAGTQGPMV